MRAKALVRYLDPTMQAVDRISAFTEIDSVALAKSIESFPIDRMRGISLAPGEWLISDEAQNCMPPLYKCLLTRAEQGAKAVIMGDVEQVDIKTTVTKTCGMQKLKLS